MFNDLIQCIEQVTYLHPPNVTETSLVIFIRNAKPKDWSDGNIYSANIRRRHLFPFPLLAPRLPASDHSNLCSSAVSLSVFRRRPRVSQGSSHERYRRDIPNVSSHVDRCLAKSDQDSTCCLRWSHSSSNGYSWRTYVFCSKCREKICVWGHRIRRRLWLCRSMLVLFRWQWNHCHE